MECLLKLKDIDIEEKVNINDDVLLVDIFFNSALNRLKKPKIIISKPDKTKLKDNDIDGKLEHFAYTLDNHFNHDDLKIFHHNLKTIKISNTCLLENYLKKEGIIGLYQIIRNRIIVFNNEYDCIYHELFHMASATISKGVIYSGFYQLSSAGVIGVALKEAYTELLARRYFNKACSYNAIVKIVEKLERIVTKDTMESLYLNADLQGLVLEISKYSSLEETINFIYNFDFLNHCFNFRSYLIDNKELFLTTLNETCNFLANTYLNKLTSDKMSTDQLYSSLNDYTCDFKNICNYKKYQGVDIDSLLSKNKQYVKVK